MRFSKLCLFSHFLLTSAIAIAQKTALFQPNILIYADGQNYNDLGCDGFSLIEIFNIDEIVSQEFQLTNSCPQSICEVSTVLLNSYSPNKLNENRVIGELLISLDPFTKLAGIAVAEVLKNRVLFGKEAFFFLSGEEQTSSRSEDFCDTYGLLTGIKANQWKFEFPSEVLIIAMGWCRCTLEIINSVKLFNLIEQVFLGSNLYKNSAMVELLMK